MDFFRRANIRRQGADRRQRTQPLGQDAVKPEIDDRTTTMQPGAPASVTQVRAQGKQRNSVRATGTLVDKITINGQEEIEKLRRDLSQSRVQMAELQARYEAQSKELYGSHNFLNTTDKSSDSDVIRAVHRLNAEVQQTTLHMADCLTEALEFDNPATNPTLEQISATQRASGRIGRVLIASLGTCAPEETPMLLQTAFQAYLASVLCQATSSWAYEPGYNKFICEVYQRLRRVESQAICGRWRSLARVYNFPAWFTHPESLVEGILSEISDIVSAAGCTAISSDIMAIAISKFHDKISLLVDLAARLCDVLAEVLLCDFEVFIALPGCMFKDKTMEDVDGGQPGVEGTSVLCTTHIGLRKRVPMGMLWEKGKKQKITVFKAKVLCEPVIT